MVTWKRPTRKRESASSQMFEVKAKIPMEANRAESEKIISDFVLKFWKVYCDVSDPESRPA